MQTDLINESIQQFIKSKDIASAKHFEELLIQKGLKPISVNTEVILESFIATDKRLLDLKDDVRALAFEKEPVLITGETGTGKELIAQALHGRRAGNFRAINCAAIPDTLLESELFGYRKGAFTGADNDKNGLFLEANNGTIFLDEIGEMPLSIQAKLLRVIQENKIRPLGDVKEKGINTRVVCATNRDLKSLSKEKLFRLDLYHRLSVFELHIEPLRDRSFSDIEAIVKSLEGGEDFWKEFGDKLHKGLEDKSISLDGNVRELQAMVRRYKVLGRI